MNGDKAYYRGVYMYEMVVVASTAANLRELDGVRIIGAITPTLTEGKRDIVASVR